MRWFNGGIAEAIAFSKTKGAVFVVYIEGKDEKSQQITKLIETAEVTSKLDNDNFVAVKIEAGSVPHGQFSEFYKQTPVPSIYFIGKNGSPIKIITEAIDASSLSKELNEVLNKAGINPLPSFNQSAASASQNFIASEQAPPKPDNVVCDNGVCVIKKDPKPEQSAPAPEQSAPVPEQSAPAPAGDQTLTAEDKMERAKKLLDAKREQKEREEKELEKQKEIERRKMGQEVQKMKQYQEDLELKQLREEREKEKRQEREARERVLAQIAQDKAERAAKAESEAKTATFTPGHYSTPTNVPTPYPSTSANTARLQFKMPDGSSKTQEFPSSDKLISAVNYVKANLNVSSKFTLSTTFPRRQFTEQDHELTLSELQLTPNAVILVLPLNHGAVSTNQGAGGMMGFVYSLLTPLFGILNFIKAFLGFGGDAGHVSGDEPSQGSSGGSRRSNSVQSCSQYNFESRLKTAGRKLVVVDFFATWCGPCKVIAPELERMAKEFPNVVFLKVDVDSNSDLTRQHNVSAMPTFIFFKNRRELTRIQGADSSGIRSTIQRYNEPKNPRAKPPPSESKTVKKQGNIRRLADINKDDDENNTWNGNSTEQM